MRKIIFTGFFGLSFLLMHSQNNQSNSFGTSGGQFSGMSTAGAAQNTFYGYQSGKVNLGGKNTFVGHNTGVVTTTGFSNTFIGASAGLKNITGTDNVFIGSDAGIGNTGGIGNTAVGSSSGVGIIKGNWNTLFGYGAGNGFDGSRNTHLGMEAGWGGSGDDNTYVGYTAGMDTKGSGNLFLGNWAGTSLTVDNTFIVQHGGITPIPLIKGDFTTGKVGIAVTSFPTTAGSVNVSGYKFFVKGGILAEEIRVATTWADYVFEKDYQLPTLKEVEQHIAEKGHLINVPSAKEVEENGISLGEIAKIQQEKIEELTLYIIEQNKVNEKQAQEIKEMKEFMMNLAAKK